MGKNQFKCMDMKDHIPSTYINFIHVTKRGVENTFMREVQWLCGMKLLFVSYGLDIF